MNIVMMVIRKVWSTISNSAVTSKCLLVDALCRVLRRASLFLGTSGVVELTLLLLECAHDGHPQVARHSFCRAKEMRAACGDAVWSDVQSLLIQVHCPCHICHHVLAVIVYVLGIRVQRFGECVCAVGRLASSVSAGGREDAVLAQVTTALGCVALLSRSELTRCMTVLLSSAPPAAAAPGHLESSYEWDALRGLQRLLVCEVSESGAALGTGFASGSAGRLCVLHSRRYYSQDGVTYADAGYFRYISVSAVIPLD
jgi:hypothetical protein